MEEMKFEEALERLEKIVSELEEGEKSLADSLKLFEEGIRLSKFCSEKLEEAKRKVEILTKGEGGEFTVKPFRIETDRENNQENQVDE